MLQEASVMGNVADFKRALESGEDVNAVFDDGKTALCNVSKCRADLVALLLNAGADPNIAGSDRITPLHWAVEYDNAEIVALLLNAGADTSARDGLGETPMHWAAWTGHHRCAERMLESGAEPHPKNGGGFTPLDLAKRQGHGEMVKLLEADK